MDEPCEPSSPFLIQEAAFPGDDDLGYETRLLQFPIHGDPFYIHASSETGGEMEEMEVLALVASRYWTTVVVSLLSVVMRRTTSGE